MIVSMVYSVQAILLISAIILQYCHHLSGIYILNLRSVQIMRRFRFLSCGLAAILILLMTACGGNSNTPSKVTINWWHISTSDPIKSTWQSLADQYMKAHPNVTIKITIIENDPFKTELANAMQAGNPPDIFQSWGGGIFDQYAKSGLLKDITANLQSSGWGDSFSPSSLALYTFDGKSYGVPWDAGAVGFWYNKALFAKANIQQPPTTWDSFLNDIRQLKAAGITPIALGEKDKWPGHFYWVYLATRLGGKAAFDKAYNRTGSFADPSFVQAGVYLQQLLALNPFQNAFMASTYNGEKGLMGNGQAAMELMGQWAPTSDASAATDKKGPSLGFFPFPSLPNEAGNPTDVMGGGNGFGIGKNAPPEAIDFVKFLTSADNQRMMAKEGVLLPPVKAAQDGITDPNLQAVAKLVSDAPYYQLYYDQFLPDALANTIKDETQALLAGTITPQDAAKSIETAAATALH
jgi:raffinose/stachyose/melibiose transport system substrate-binding protein